MTLFKSSFQIFIINALAALAQFLGIAYFAQQLGATVMGIFFLFEAMRAIIATPADFGLIGALEKRISENTTPGSFLTSAIVLKSAPLSVVIVTILLIEQHLNRYIGSDVAVFLVLALLFQQASQTTLATLRGERRVSETVALELVGKICWIAAGVVLVNLGFEVYALIFGTIFRHVLVFVLAAIRMSYYPKRFTRTHLRSLFDFGKYNVISDIGGDFHNWLDVAIIGIFLTQAHVGAYETAWRVTAIGVFLSRAIAAVIFPEISRLDAEEDLLEVESLIEKGIKGSVLLVIPSFFGTLLFSKDILRFLFGTEFETAWLVLIILMGEKGIQAVYTILNKSLKALNHPNLTARATIVSVATNILLNLILVSQLGIEGAAIATTVSIIANLILHNMYLSDIIEVKFPIRFIISSISASLCMYATIRILLFRYSVSSLTDLIILALIGGLLYFIFALLFPPLRSTLKDTLQSIRI